MGVEVYFTGKQRVEANPRRSVSEPYVLLGVLAERRFGRWSLFVNLENLTDVRQSQWEPLLRDEHAVDGRWTVDAWAPLDGRVIGSASTPFVLRVRRPAGSIGSSRDLSVQVSDPC